MCVWYVGHEMGNPHTRNVISLWIEKKTNELVRCLCCLHNFCIDGNINIGSREESVPTAIIHDELELIVNIFSIRL